MSSTPVRPTAVAVAALVGTLALGACGAQQVADADAGPDPMVTQEVAAGEEEAAQEAAPAQGAAPAPETAPAHEAAAAQEAARAEAARLRQLRLTHPTAGLEVPPDTLLVNVTEDEAPDDASSGGDTPDSEVTDDGTAQVRQPGGWLLRTAE